MTGAVNISSGINTGTTSHPEADKVGEAQQLYASGKELFESGDYEAAVDVYQKALQIQELVLGKYHSDTIKTYWRIGRASSMNFHNYPKALVSFKRALRMAEGSYGKNDERTVTLLGDISEQLTKLAPERFKEMSDGSRDHEKDFQSIVSAVELEREGDMLSKQRKYKRATEKYLEAIDLEERAFDASSLDCADVKCKVACMYRLRGDLERSCYYFREAHDRYQENFGDDHPATLGAHASIRNILSSSSQRSTLSSSSSVSFGGLRFRSKKSPLRDPRNSRSRHSWWGVLSSSFNRKGEPQHPPQISV